MARKNLSEWLAWQESLNPAEIELGLDRIRRVSDRLDIRPPQNGVIMLAGTNGKGSTAAVIETLLNANGRKTGLYTSPHLVRYNERIRVAGEEVTDAELVDTFERIEAARDDVPLTFFEFGTLAALQIFTGHQCDAWVLEIGLGGRLDAVNLIDPDVAVITTIALDHQDWLGNTLEEIATEKAGIIRAGRPVLFGDTPVPAAISAKAADLGAHLLRQGQEFCLNRKPQCWDWQGSEVAIKNLPLPATAGHAQLLNTSLALAAVESLDAGLLDDAEMVRRELENCMPAGRFQVFRDTHEWVFDVAHNSQAAEELNANVLAMGPAHTVMIIGMLADKDLQAFCAQMDGLVNQWIICPILSGRGADAAGQAEQLRAMVSGDVSQAASVAEAIRAARADLPAGGRIVVSGSFQVVGPALEQLGLY